MGIPAMTQPHDGEFRKLKEVPNVCIYNTLLQNWLYIFPVHVFKQIYEFHVISVTV
jgi:hypothetical protein